MAARETYSHRGSAGPCLGPADESTSARSSRALRGTAAEGANDADGPLSSLWLGRLEGGAEIERHDAQQLGIAHLRQERLAPELEHRARQALFGLDHRVDLF